tara:strand:- start:37 stop:240 length:204 start_codon:yes stop_codon:yes gene_type:complete
MYKVYSHPEEISLNGRQYLLDEDDEVKEFASIPDVFKFLNDAGVDASTPDELEEDFDIFITEEEGDE